MPLCLFNPADVHLFFENEAAFDFEDFFNDGNDGDISLLAYGGHGLDWPVDGDALDFDLLELQQLIDELLMLVSYSRDLHTRCFDYALGDREFFFKDWNDGFAVGMRGRGTNRVQVIKGRIHKNLRGRADCWRAIWLFSGNQHGDAPVESAALRRGVVAYGMVFAIPFRDQAV